MQLERANPTKEKGWYLGPWNTDLGISIGYANAGIEAPHAHRRMTEAYLVARGWALVRIETRTVELNAGDVRVIEPGDAHTFLSSSEDYLHFVLHLPALPPDEALADRVDVPRSRLDLET
jgi:mannose-6-phosphate isomerase-like protein (cupin superfamily)